MKYRLKLASVAIAGALSFAPVSFAALKVGDKAPDFTLTSAEGKPVKLTELLAKGPVVIYTFIQAFTGT